MAGTVTGTAALNIALALMDEIGTTEYNTMALSYINLLIDELYPYSDTYTVVTAGTRPVATPITALGDTITSLDDNLTRAVLPYGLSAMLLVVDEPERASFLQQKFEEMKVRMRTAPAEFAAITDIYGGIEYGDDSSWTGSSSED